MNIYELLNKIITEKHHYFLSKSFTESDRAMLDENDGPLFDLLKNISSVGTHINNNSITFYPMFTFENGNRTFTIEDIKETDYKMLENIDLNKLPLILRALVSDILWNQKKNFKASQIAAQSYWEMFKLLYDNENYNKALDPIKRAVCISAQTKPKTNSQSLYSDIYTWFCDFLINKATQVNNFFSLRVMELFLEQKNNDPSLFLPVLDSIISQNNNNDNVLTVEQAYNLKTKCLYKLKKEEDATNNNLFLAKYYFDYAEKVVHREAMGVLRAGYFFEKAIKIYRNNGATVQAENVHKKLVEVQKQIPKNMHIIYTKFDDTKANENIKANMDGLTFEESIIRLTQFVGFESKAAIKKRTIEECNSDPLSNLFGNNLLDSQGQTIVKFSPLDDKDPEKDPQLELHMFQNSLRIQRIVGNIWVNNVLCYIRNKFLIDDSMLEFLTKDNCIIPERRERIFRNGIGMFLRGEYCEAMHILAPQMENLFRNIAKEVGGLTTTLSDDGLSQKKVLGTVFTLPELLDAYDNDILFTFQGLLNEQAEANIRNKIAHGIIEEAECSSGECLFFGALVIKLLSFTSHACNEIICNSEKIKHFKKPNKGDVKIIY